MILAADNYNRADENPLDNGVWSTQTGESAWLISGNKAAPSNLGADCVSRYSGISWPNDQYSEGAITVSGTAGLGSGPGLALRCASAAATYYRFVIDHAASNNLEIGKVVAASYTILGQISIAFSDGERWRFGVSGAQLFLGKDRGILASFSDSSIASGSPGLIYSSTNSGPSVDNWEGGNLISGLSSFTEFPIKKLADRARATA